MFSDVDDEKRAAIHEIRSIFLKSSITVIWVPRNLLNSSARALKSHNFPSTKANRGCTIFTFYRCVSVLATPMVRRIAADDRVDSMKYSISYRHQLIARKHSPVLYAKQPPP